MTQPIPPLLLNLLARELERGERVVWYACPTPLSRVILAIPVSLFGIAFLGFALHWTWGATERFSSSVHGLGWLEYLWGGMFVLAGVAMLFSPLWALWVAPRTLYAVTDRRAIHIEVPLGRATVRSFAGEQLEGVVRRERPNGRGDLIFERATTTTDPKGRTIHRDVGFYGIDDVRAVQRLLPVPSAPPAGQELRRRKY